MNVLFAPASSSAALAFNRSSAAERIVGFLDTATHQQVDTLLSDAKTHAEEFATRFRASAMYQPSPELEQTLNRWFFSADGQVTSRALTRTALEVVQRCNSHGHPGHDSRHTVLLDPLSALRHCTQDSIGDYRSLFLVGALYHDIGRLCEPRLHGAPAAGVRGSDHQILGFAITQQLLDGFPEIPSELRDAILFAILVHQSGTDRENFAAQLVQRADREQLVGPEFPLRAIPFNVGFRGLDFGIPCTAERAFTLAVAGGADEQDVANHLEFYLRNLYPNIGREGPHEAERLKVRSAVFLALAHGDRGFECLFSPELNPGRPHGKFKKALLPGTWQAIQQELQTPFVRSLRNQQGDAATACENLLAYIEAPLTQCVRTSRVNELDPSSPSVWSVVVKKFLELSPEACNNWNRAVLYGIAARDENIANVYRQIRAEVAGIAATSPVVQELFHFLSTRMQMPGEP